MLNINFEQLSFTEKCALCSLFNKIQAGNIFSIGLHQNDFLFALDKVLFGEIEDGIVYNIQIKYSTNYISAIKFYRMITNCGLKEAKLFIDENKNMQPELNIINFETRSIVYAKLIKYIAQENGLTTNIITMIYQNGDDE